jgi:hypothetical protein
MSKKDKRETRTLFIKYGKDVKKYQRCYNITETKDKYIEYVEFDFIIDAGFLFKPSHYHIKMRGRIIITMHAI